MPAAVLNVHESWVRYSIARTLSSSRPTSNRRRTSNAPRSAAMAGLIATDMRLGNRSHDRGTETGRDAERQLFPDRHRELKLRVGRARVGQLAACHRAVFPTQWQRPGAPLFLEFVGALVRRRAAEVEDRDAVRRRGLQDAPVQQVVGTERVELADGRSPRNLEAFAALEREAGGDGDLVFPNDVDSAAARK